MTNPDASAVYFLTPNGTLMKVRATDGSSIWSRTNGAPVGVWPGRNLVVAGGTLIVGSTHLVGFDTTTGVMSWSYTTSGDEPGRFRLETDGTTVFAGSFLGKVYAVDGATGTVRWITPLASDAQAQTGSPTLAHGMVYVCTRESVGPFRGALWALDAVSGAVRWTHRFTPEFPQQGSSCLDRAAHVDDYVIQSQDDGRIFAFDALRGDVRWIAPRVHKIPTPTDPTGSWSDERQVAAHGDNLLATSVTTGLVISLDPRTGRERWRTNPVGGSSGYPLLDSSKAWIKFDGTYVSLDLATGALRWQDPQPGVPRTTAYATRPALGTDRIFVMGHDAMYALKP